MRSVELTYRYEQGGSAAGRERPSDAAAAKRRMNDGSQAFAALFATLDGQPGATRREIHLDPRDLGLLPGEDKAPAQRPYAAILGCSDARVPIELIFNEGPNDLFVVRVAGNTLGEDVFGSLNYALEHLGASLKLVVVLGHSGCGAVSAAVDVFRSPASYLGLTTQHAVRGLIDRLQIVVHASAVRMEAAYGSGIRNHPRYRDALIEVAVVSNAAVAAHTIARQIGGESAVRAAYGVYVLAERMVWAPRCGGPQVTGLADPPMTPEAFVEFSEATIRSERIARMLAD